MMITKEQMIKSQIIARGIKDKRVLSALEKVDRCLFVPAQYQSEAYEDHPLSIGFNQTISQPYIVAFMTEALHLKETDRVLEIGTGSGYQTAVLAEISKEVYSIEIVEDLAKEAAQRVKNLGYTNIFIKNDDGYQGWEESAPFAAVIVTAAAKEIPPHLIDQLNINARMIIPLGEAEQDLYLITKKLKGIKKDKLFSVRFVPLVIPKNGNC